MLPTADIRRRLQRRLRRVHLDPPPDVVEGLITYYSLLRRWNEKINLTSLPDGDEAVDRLLVEPLLAARLMTEPTALVVDVGSGGGSPAIPLKLVTPTLDLWMIESKARKSAFLREVVRQLSLQDARVETSRAEDLVERPEIFGLADAVTMRAVRADLKTLASLQQFLRPGGELLFFTRLGGSGRLLLPPQLERVGEEALLPALQTSLLRLRKRLSLPAPVNGAA